MKSAAPGLASQTERVKRISCKEFYAEILQSSKAKLYRANLMPPTGTISPHLTTVSCPLPMRILHFCDFHKFLHVFIFSKIKLNPIEGVISAVFRQPSGVIPCTIYLMVLAFSLNKSKCKKNLENTNLQNPYRRRGAGVPPGSFRVLFFRILKFEKRTFSKKGPELEKT